MDPDSGPRRRSTCRVEAHLKFRELPQLFKSVKYLRCQQLSIRHYGAYANITFGKHFSYTHNVPADERLSSRKCHSMYPALREAVDYMFAAFKRQLGMYTFGGRKDTVTAAVIASAGYRPYSLLHIH